MTPVVFWLLAPCKNRTNAQCEKKSKGAEPGKIKLHKKNFHLTPNYYDSISYLISYLFEICIIYFGEGA